jgi:hypothetical protein
MASPGETYRTRRQLSKNKRQQGAAAANFLFTFLFLKEKRWEDLGSLEKQMAWGVYRSVRRWVYLFLHSPLSDAKEFFYGFGNALHKGAGDEHGRPTSNRGDEITFHIKHILVNEWKEVETLRLKQVGVPSLASFVLAQLPANVAAGHATNPALKKAFVGRVGKICERCGLKMAKRGNPGSKIPRD